VRFLADSNIVAEAVRAMRAAGHDVVYQRVGNGADYRLELLEHTRSKRISDQAAEIRVDRVIEGPHQIEVRVVIVATTRAVLLRKGWPLIEDANDVRVAENVPGPSRGIEVRARAGIPELHRK